MKKDDKGFFEFLCFSTEDGKDCIKSKIKDGKCIYFKNEYRIDRCQNFDYQDEKEIKIARLRR